MKKAMKRRAFAQAGGGGNPTPFYAWVDEGETPTLVIDGVIDTGMSWYDDAVTPKAFREALERYEGKDILVSINSPGGDCFAGFEIYNMLAMRKGGTAVRVMGLAASAASYIAMAADPGKLTMCAASMMMIHSPWSGVRGNAADMRREAEVLDEIEALMRAIYMQRFTGTEEELRALLENETYMSPTQALERGLIDAIEEPFESGESLGAAADMAQRYAALDRGAIGELRSRLKIVPRSKPAGVPAADYLKMADAAIATMR